MQLRKLAELVAAEVLSGDEHLDLDVARVLASDLMSDVLALAPHGALLVTSLTSAQSVRAAEIADLCGVLMVGNRRPAADTLTEARARKLPVLVTRHSMFDACGILYQNQLRSAVPARNVSCIG